jgi:hypothetical protein
MFLSVLPNIVLIKHLYLARCVKVSLVRACDSQSNPQTGHEGTCGDNSELM